MSAFAKLQARHEQILRKQSEDEDVLEEAQAYIKRVRVEASQVGRPQEREQLRANLRYWSGYVYERTASYPGTDLAPAAEGIRPSRSGFPARNLVLVSAILLGSLIIVVLMIITGPRILAEYFPSSTPSITPTASATLSNQAAMQTAEARAVGTYQAVLEEVVTALVGAFPTAQGSPATLDPLHAAASATASWAEVGTLAAQYTEATVTQMAADAEALATLEAEPGTGTGGGGVAEEQIAYVDANSRVNLRTGPGEAYHVIGQVDPGQEVIVIARSQNKWFNVAVPVPDADDAMGWVFGKFIRGSANAIPLEEAPIVETIPPTPREGDPFPTVTRTSTPVPPPTLRPVSTPTPAGAPTPDSGAIAVMQLTFGEGDEVQATEVVTGTYQNLRLGWTIHVLLRPISGEDQRWYPAEDSFVIEDSDDGQEDLFSGDWAVEVDFGNTGEVDLRSDLPELFRMLVVVANTQEATTLLNEAARSGMAEIPRDLLVFPPQVELVLAR